MKKEEIKKNVEINDNELEQVSGGGGLSDTTNPLQRECPQCDGTMLRCANGSIRHYYCTSCGHSIIIEQ